MAVCIVRYKLVKDPLKHN